LSSLERKRANLRIVEIGIEGKVTHPPHSIRLCSLSLEVACVFDLEIGCNDGFPVERCPDTDSLKKVIECYVLAFRDIAYA